MFMLVAHRNMISVYDMTKKTKKSDNLTVSQMSIENTDSKLGGRQSDNNTLRAQSNVS